MQRSFFVLFFAAIAITLPAVPASANFETVGDVSGTVPLEGGSTGALIIGDTGLGGFTADAEPAFNPLEALVSDSAIIGNQLAGIGAATLDSFIAQWEITGDLTVGNEGQGFLTLVNSATIEVGGDTIIGEANTGQGIVNINGTNFPGARLLTSGLLTVGQSGVGVVNVTDRGSLFSAGDVIIGELAGADGTVALDGLGSRWNIVGTLGIGGSATTASGTLIVANQALVQASGTTTVNPNGIIDLSGGTFRDLSGTDIANAGLVRGNGFLDASMTIGLTGELRNYGQAGNYPPEEALRVTGVVTNDGTIESLGGEMEFESAVTNSFEIFARDAVMRFPAGLTNTGSLTLGGDTTLHGLVTMSGTGRMTILSNSSVAQVGDIIFASAGILALSIGGEPGIFDITGTADLSGALFDLNYLGAAAPVSGDSYQLIQAGGGISGAFSPVASDGTNIWDITQSGSTLLATFNGVAANPMGADFNGDGAVDGLDMAIWKANFPIASGATISLGDADNDGDVDTFDFLKIQRDFGVIPVPPLVGGAVPEPSSIALLMLGGVLAIGRRSRRAS